ncbi:MAG: MgtC/SapB family protein [Desulfuromonadaceae bacterium]|nr:MgtC/SapB family protein [Desulfuromonas sp.]MDY0184558.1 MgtC/SapB family protein [Desulfuromonadaceae bacterium]
MAETFLFNEDIGAQLVKMLLAFFAGGLIGVEREKHGRPAGLRTHVLVSTGACLMMIVSESIFIRYGHLSATGIARIDPGRIGAQIVTGIGFLGAGVILKEGINVRGLTTAACLWYVAGVGMAFGFGLVGIGICSTALAFLALFGLKYFDPVFRKDRFLRLSVVCAAEVDIFEDLKTIFQRYALRTTNVEQELDLENQRRQYDFIITHSQKPMGRTLIAEISKINGITKVRYK